MAIRGGLVIMRTWWVAVLMFAAVANGSFVTAASDRYQVADRPGMLALLQPTQPGTTVSTEAIIERVRQVDVRTLDPELPSARFEEWLRGLLGEDRRIEWRVTDCGEQTGNPAADRGRVFPACVEASAVLTGDRAFSISIVSGTWRDGTIVPGAAALWHAVVTRTKGQQTFLRRLGAVPAVIEEIRGQIGGSGPVRAHVGCRFDHAANHVVEGIEVKPRLAPSAPTFAHACQHLRELWLASRARLSAVSRHEAGGRPRVAGSAAIVTIVLRPLACQVHSIEPRFSWAASELSGQLSAAAAVHPRLQRDRSCSPSAS
jgi:hypothetical protein